MSFIEPKYPDLEIPRLPIVARVFPALLARWSVSSKSITGDRTAVTVIEPIVIWALKDYSRGQMEIDKFKVPSVKSAVVQYHIVDLVVGTVKLQTSLELVSDKLIELSVCKGVAAVVQVLDRASPVRGNDVHVYRSKIQSRSQLGAGLRFNLVQESSLRSMKEENQATDGGEMRGEMLHLSFRAISIELDKIY